MQLSRQPERTLLIGIDDTDNLDSRGTGYRARCLGALLHSQGLGRINGISRHQLLVDDAIPYTSHNSSACLRLELAANAEQAEVINICRQFLQDASAPGSDAGLCVMPLERTNESLQSFGKRAQREVLQRREAEEVAESEGTYLEGLTGDHGGVIGALAAVGLRAWGQDGRFVWVEGIRERAGKQMSLATLFAETGVDAVMTLARELITDGSQIINLGPWPRPIAHEGRAVLLVEENHDNQDSQWRVVDRTIIKRY